MLGKLVSSGLQFVLCLLAVFPVIALFLLRGGVTGAEVLRPCLNLLTIVFLGISVGLFGSVVCREVKAPTSLGFFVMLFIVLAPACAMIAILSAMGGFSPPPILGVLLGLFWRSRHWKKGFSGRRSGCICGLSGLFALKRLPPTSQESRVL